MKVLPYHIAGEGIEVRVIETRDDVEECERWILEHDKYELCFDTETTGLDQFADDFRVRTIQIGDATRAYVLVLRSVRDRWARLLLERMIELGFSAHNFPFDAVACHVTGLMLFSQWEDCYHDTRILSHLLDPRSKMDGGVGHALKDLAAVYVDPTAPDTQNGLKEEFHKIGATLQTGWKLISSDNPTYLLYAGLDTILGARYHAWSRPTVNREGYGHLARFEHELQRVTTRMKIRGFRVDEDYSRKLVDRLQNRYDAGVQSVALLGVENMNSPKQIAENLLSRGWRPEEFTKTGNPKTDKAVMEALIEDVNTPLEVRELLEAIIGAKRARKWKTAYAEAMLEARDFNDHVHPDINSLQARTSRMSISNPPLQQLPSRGDDAWIIRRQVISDEGYVIGSADYDQVEFRVLAGLAGISQMKYAIANGIDLHDYTAQLVYGEDFTKAQRNMGKGIGFGKVFGGGAKTLSRQTGAPIDQVRAAIKAYEEAYFELPKFQRDLQTEQRLRGGYILNHHGRYLPLDSGREYAAVNYSVQSIARDLLAQALIDLSAAGLDDYLLLPVHDEILFQAPEEDALDIAHTVGETMSGTFIDVPISATGEIYGKSWAEGYVFRDAQGNVRSKGTKNIINDWVEVAA